jgi:hypothetical protein
VTNPVHRLTAVPPGEHRPGPEQDNATRLELAEAWNEVLRAVCGCSLVAHLRQRACAFFTWGKEGCALPLLVHPTVGGGMARSMCPPVSFLLDLCGAADQQPRAFFGGSADA